jgi:hypothetical protein
VRMDTHSALVLDLYYVKKRNIEGTGRNIARRVYGKIDKHTKQLAERFIREKHDAGPGRYSLAHPNIPDAGVRKFLEDLKLGDSPLAQAAISHINSTANNESNIQETNRG